MATEANRPRLKSGATLADVGREAGVDQSTVSRVLSGDSRARVTDLTRTRIKDAASKLGYVPNATARSLATSRTSTLGLLVPNSGSLVFANIIRGANEAARELGYVLVVADASELGHVSDAVRQLVLEGRVDGLLIASGTTSDTITDELVGSLNNCVILNRRISNRAPSIIEDDEFGMYLCTKELIDAGHLRIACLAGPPDIDTSGRRIVGFRRALREAQLKLGREAIVHAPFDEAGGHAGMLKILGRKTRPTAVASTSLAMAVGAMAAARELGIRIPNDVSITGFHDAPIANYLAPPLTTIAMPLAELGRQGVVMLHRRLIGEPGPLHVKVLEPRPVLIRRASVGPPPN